MIDETVWPGPAELVWDGLVPIGCKHTVDTDGSEYMEIPCDPHCELARLPTGAMYFYEDRFMGFVYSKETHWDTRVSYVKLCIRTADDA